jgi:pimeloyl-ACP methyl ester carboxylesterase
MTSEVPNEPAKEHPADEVAPGITRRGVVRVAGAGALALGLSGATGAAAQAASAASRKRPGSTSQPPNPPKGFTSQFINAGGLRQHVVIGGSGPPLLLIHGWPQFWYAWRLVMPALARDFSVIAVDQRGRGLTSKPPPGPSGQGYDTATLANDLAALMDALGHRSFAVVGHDTGLDIGYALAADHPGRVERLAVAEAVLPGVGTPPLFSVPWCVILSRCRSLRCGVHGRIADGRPCCKDGRCAQLWRSVCTVGVPADGHGRPRWRRFGWG